METLTIDNGEYQNLKNKVKYYSEVISQLQPLFTLANSNDLNECIKQYIEQREQITYFERLAKDHNNTINILVKEKELLETKYRKQNVIIQNLQDDKDTLSKCLNHLIDNS